MNLESILSKAESTPKALSIAELSLLLSLGSDEERRLLHEAGRRLKSRYCGRGIAARALIEMGNICAKDCLYCGIRKSNCTVSRYQLDVEDVEALARQSIEAGYASLVLQSGELESPSHTDFIEECIRRIVDLDSRIRKPGADSIGITLSLGEQTEEALMRWRKAGAARYLLRIESSNPELYASIHPSGHSYERRVECLRALRHCDYQVGTGVMTGLPGQTAADLARDIVFFSDIDADMIGMGPFIPHRDTPLGAPFFDDANDQGLSANRLRLGVDMIAATRLYLHNVNIAATTALQTLAPDGREQGILAGANVIMPNVTDTRFRRNYQLYEGKPDLDENADETRNALQQSISSIGECIIYGKRGDSPHFHSQSRK